MFEDMYTKSNSIAKNLLACVSVLFLMVGCGGSDVSKSNNDNNARTKSSSPNITLSSNFQTIDSGESVTLSWSSSDTSECTASGDWTGTRAVSGSWLITSLMSDSTFNLSCSGVAGTVSDSVSVTVNSVSAPSSPPTAPPSPPPTTPAPTVNISASPSNVAYSGSTQLSWVSSNADSCTASGNWSGTKSTSGNTNRANLTTDKTYVITCNSTSGVVSDSVSITVAAPAAPTINLSASPTNLPYDGSTTLNWNSSNTSNCTASGDWSGARSTSGNTTRSNLTSNKTYVLTCNSTSGVVSDSVSVTVAAPAAPTLTFSASPGTVSQNGSTTLTWNATNVTSCTAAGDWSGNKAVSGSETINSILIDRQFTLTCSGITGNVNDTANVQVVLSNNGSALLSWIPPTENTDNSPLTDLAGYNIYYGTSPGSYNKSITINNPGTASYLVENLASSVWYFVMTSFNSSAIESSYSMEVTKTIN